MAYTERSCFMEDLRKKIETELQPASTSPKISDKLKLHKAKPTILKKVNHECGVNIFKCDLCVADNITCHLHQNINEHRASAIGKQIKEGLSRSQKTLS